MQTGGSSAHGTNRCCWRSIARSRVPAALAGAEHLVSRGPVHHHRLALPASQAGLRIQSVNRVFALTLTMDHTISCISDPSAVEIRMSRNEEVSQATKGDDSVTWIGRMK